MRVQAEFLNTMPPREFVDCITDDLFRQGVFVFTPGGQAMRLPKVLGCRATPLLHHLLCDQAAFRKAGCTSAAPTSEHASGCD